MTIFDSFASNYNATILGNYYASLSDTEGRHLTTGNFSIDPSYTGYTVGAIVVGNQNGPSAGRSELVIGGNYTGGTVAVVTENAIVGGSVLSGSINPYNGAPISYPYESSGTGVLTTDYVANNGAITLDPITGNVTVGGVTLDQIAAGMRSESLAMSQVGDSAGISLTDDGYGSIGITASGAADTYVVNVDASFWAGVKYRTVTAPVGSTLIINVSGSDMDLAGTMSLSGVDYSHVLINYFEAKSFTIVNGMEHEGALLAPVTETASLAGSVNGSAVLAGEVTKVDTAEFHNYLWEGSLPVPSPVPEPSSMILLACGTLAMLLRRFR